MAKRFVSVKIFTLSLLGRLFSNQRDELNKTEIVLLITPRIIRNIERQELAQTEFFGGTESAASDQALQLRSVPGMSPVRPLGKPLRPIVPIVPATPAAPAVPDGAVAPAEPEGRYKHNEFVHLRGNQVLIIFVTNSGTVTNKLVEMDETPTQHELNSFSSYLDEELEHLTLPEVRERLVERLREEKAGFLIGKDPRAKLFLEKLDNDLQGACAKFDIVDAKTMDDLENKPFEEILSDAIMD